MNLHLYYFDEHKNNIIHRLVKCKETASRYTPDKPFPYIAMSHLPKDNIGRAVGMYGKAVMFTEKNDYKARAAFADYYSKEKLHMIEVVNYKQKKIGDMEKLIDEFDSMEIEERSWE